MSEETEAQIGVLSESEHEARRKWIVERILELSKMGNSPEGQLRIKEIDDLEKELLQISPVGAGYQGLPPEIKEERRKRTEDREIFRKILDSYKE